MNPLVTDFKKDSYLSSQYQIVCVTETMGGIQNGSIVAILVGRDQ